MISELSHAGSRQNHMHKTKLMREFEEVSAVLYTYMVTLP